MPRVAWASWAEERVKKTKKTLHASFGNESGCEDAALCGTVLIKMALVPVTPTLYSQWPQTLSLLMLSLFTSFGKKGKKRETHQWRHHTDSTINTDLEEEA